MHLIRGRTKWRRIFHLEEGQPMRDTIMDSRLAATPGLILAFTTSVSAFWFTPQGPQIYSCLNYTEKNLRVDCEFPATGQIPGPYCEFKQDGKIIGTTYPNTPSNLIPVLEVRRRANVSLVSPTICRLSWAPLTDDRYYTYTCRVYQGSSWKENSMAFHHKNVLVCSAISLIFQTGPWLLGLMMSLPVSMGLLPGC